MRLLLILLLLAGCATPEQKADKMVERYGPACSKLGYQADSDKWRDCIVAMNGSRRGVVQTYSLNPPR